MSKPRDNLRVAVCILRMEAQGDQVLIKVTTNGNLDRNLYSARSEPEQWFTDPLEAVEEVTNFLLDLLR